MEFDSIPPIPYFPIFDDNSFTEADLPTTYEQADAAFDDEINTRQDPNEKEVLLIHKKIVLYDLKRIQDLGLGDEAFADTFRIGMYSLKELSESHQNKRSSFNQEIYDQSSRAKELLEKVDKVGALHIDVKPNLDAKPTDPVEGEKAKSFLESLEESFSKINLNLPEDIFELGQY